MTSPLDSIPTALMGGSVTVAGLAAIGACSTNRHAEYGGDAIQMGAEEFEHTAQPTPVPMTSQPTPERML